ncbi:MAG: GCN5-related N-acetyltransferase [Candidatus Parvarchaeum acidophilus ARMAN-5]|jgi:RimJ/RimL family protein N-acetyltransferase|uniref:GCN5-related N-acetyltransferase n=1 Tax=Candidatus Parvarchaeum acidophilus ARMAN-5 TaxID=662762 RepID=D6GX34_PARA5|nr:MAG: GCN5-related N-acetyltransferase [Candidatus Parvarchaeum acidophilus ARMAN-5]
MKLETTRLILRTAKKNDWKDIFEGASDLEIAKNTLLIPHPYRKVDAVNFIAHCIKEQGKKNSSHYDLFIELKADKKVIGVTSIHRSKEDKNVGITGSWINKNYWRRGYILEAKVAVLDFAFNKLKLRRVESEAFTENKASNLMSEKLGFKLEGTKRKSVTAVSTGIVHDVNIYGMLRDEWVKKRGEIIKNVRIKIKKNG